MKYQPLFIILIFSFLSSSLIAQSDLQNPKDQLENQRKKTEQPPTTYPVDNTSVVSTLKTHSIGIGVGQTFLAGDFKELGEDKISLDLYYSYAASYSFDFLVNFHYSTLELRNQEITIPGLAFSIKAKAFQFDQFSPFLVAGLGFYKPQATREVAPGVTQDTKSKVVFGSNLGVGVDLRLNEKVSFGLLFHYHNPFDVKQDNGGPLEGSYSKMMITSTYTF